MRRDGIDPAGCKHVRALVVLGMIAESPVDPYGEPARPVCRSSGLPPSERYTEEHDGPGEPMRWATGGHEA
jgi:hypothetical protein